MHDANGKPLKVGDEVVLRAKITQLTGGEKYCNVNIQAVHPMPIEPYSGCKRCGMTSATATAHQRWEGGNQVDCDGEFGRVEGRLESFSSVNTKMLEKVD